MQMGDMVLVSIDDHVIEPEDMFENHMPEKYKDEAPRYVHDPATDRGYWEFQGQETGMSGLGAVASWIVSASSRSIPPPQPTPSGPAMKRVSSFKSSTRPNSR